MTDLPARLQEALGDAYRLERELGGGGMSRLFIATERSLNRQVVVKVLPPELTSEVSAARFKQEIEVAARLQHPHIVPILGAGASGDLLYYIMPYVRGESLRHRLVESGKLPVADAVRILSEVSRAIGYAHRQGIVHRDIKPENILLEDGQAVLADFGVARAIVAARTSDVASDADSAVMKHITATGMSVGTPTYMAPEQAAGENTVDSRADLYALAVVGYEMLTGEHPFAATSAQKMIVAHMTQPAPSVSKLRPDTPIAVSAALVRALEKDPDARFRTAEDFRAALEGGAVHAPRASRASRPALRHLGVAALLIALVTIGVVVARRQRVAPLDANLIAVAPFDVVDADLKLWHEGMVDVLSRNLDGAGPLRTVSPTLVLRRFAGRTDKESAVALGQSTGARLAVFGSLIRSGSDSVLGSATVVDAGSGKILGEVQRGDALSRMSRLSDSLTVGLLRELGRTRSLGVARISSVGTTSLPALKAFLQGEQFFRQSAWDSAIAYYERAIASDSQFAIAWRHEGEALGWNLQQDSSDAYRIRAQRFNRGLAPRDSMLIEAAALFGTFMDGATPETAYYATQHRLFRILNDAARLYPNDPSVWQALGDAQMHLGDGRGMGVTERDVLMSFNHSISLDSAFTPSYYHAASLGFRYSTELGRRYLNGFLSQHPVGASADGMRLAYRLTDPALAHSIETQQIEDTASAPLLSTAVAVLVNWPDSAETALRLETLLASRGKLVSATDSTYRRQQLAYLSEARGHGASAMRLMPDAMRIIEYAVLGLLPPSVVDTLFRAKVPKDARISSALSFFGIRGDTLAMHRTLREYQAIPRAQLTPEHRRSGVYYVALVQAYDALARHDTVAALGEFASLPDSSCFHCAWPALLISQVRLLELRGRREDAEKILNEAGVEQSLLRIYFELEHARIAEKRNDIPRAREGYAYVADMWQNGDPPFQVYVTEARAALKRLGSGDAETRIHIGAAKDTVH